MVIKDNPLGVGRRPTDFYRQLADLKNVVMLDVRELGVDIVRAASAVCTITGSAGFEAAAMGKPVIAFGRHNIYNFLPHVRVITDDAQLRPQLNDVLDPSFDHERAEADGRRFIEAVKRTSFDMGSWTERDLAGFSREALEDAYAALVSSFEPAEEVLAGSHPDAER